MDFLIIINRMKEAEVPDIIFLPHLARILGCKTDDFFDMHYQELTNG